MARIRIHRIFCPPFFDRPWDIKKRMSFMEGSRLSPLQSQIKKALVDLGEKSRYPESVLAKKIRENTAMQGKKKAGIALSDLEKALESLSLEGQYFSLMVNSANDLLMEKTSAPGPLSAEERSRRLKSEKSMSLFSNSDLAQKNHQKTKARERTRSQNISIYSNFEDAEY